MDQTLRITKCSFPLLGTHEETLCFIKELRKSSPSYAGFLRQCSSIPEYTALHKSLTGRHAVLTLPMRVAQRRGPGARIELRVINGLPAALIAYASAIKRQASRVVMRCEVNADGRIRALHTILASSN